MMCSFARVGDRSFALAPLLRHNVKNEDPASSYTDCSNRKDKKPHHLARMRLNENKRIETRAEKDPNDH